MLRIEHLTKHYKGSSKGVTDLSLHIAPGDIYAFIGHNGAGKTTTLKCAAGIQDFDAGTIQVGGLDIQKAPLECKRQFAYIPDNPDLYEYLTGIQYLNFVADVFRVGAREREERIREYGDRFEITASLGDLISTYSHGMKQKLALLSALVHQPRLWILDEPFVGLDPKAAVILKEIMRSVCAGGGAIFFSTHVLDVAERLCNKVAIIRDGALAACGNMEDILRQGQSLESIFMEVVDHGGADRNAD
ncbi:MAG: ABC transporter ATP-binding protein [Acetatifactor sp.]|nr:ABC transporter ATP-binding protein [Acetatifactor sp.]MDE7354054.1 ABC transporter ATP-binding protein [Acetatifactor sp.]